MTFQAMLATSARTLTPAYRTEPEESSSESEIATNLIPLYQQEWVRIGEKAFKINIGQLDSQRYLSPYANPVKISEAEKNKTIINDLFFLALCPEDPLKNIFPRAQAELLEQSDYWNTRNAIGLRFGLIPVLFCSITGLVGFISLTPNLTDQEKVALITIIAVAGSFGSALLSFIFTGTLPHLASSYSNERQDAIYELTERFNDLSEYLLVLYASPAHTFLAQEMAKKLKMRCEESILEPQGALYMRAASQGLSPNAINRIFKKLDCAIALIVSKTNCGNITFQDFITVHCPDKV